MSVLPREVESDEERGLQGGCVTLVKDARVIHTYSAFDSLRRSHSCRRRRRLRLRRRRRCGR